MYTGYLTVTTGSNQLEQRATILSCLIIFASNQVTSARYQLGQLLGESYQLDIGTPTITTLMLPRAALQAAETILTAKGR